MNCIKKENIQRYVDGETSPEEHIRIEKHISECEKCAERIDHQRKLASGIKKAMELLSEEPISFSFIMKPTTKYEKRSYFSVRRIALLAAAASIIVFFIIFSSKKEPVKQAEIILIEPVFAPEFDANRPVSQQDIVITIIDSEGNRSEYLE